MIKLLIEKMKKFNQIKTVFYHCMFGLLGAFIFLVGKALILPGPISIGTVDLTGLVHQYTIKIAHGGGSLADIKSKMRPWSQHLEAVLQSISEKHHVVLMPRQAVVSGAKDYTNEAAALLSKEIALDPRLNR